ncbi:MAG: hypothetical protein KAS32_17140 [Candidatus Peribacteraceae bacterium]|nr:hypothetical protein [Candidatus Peribacteraceae bacterium]
MSLSDIRTRIADNVNRSDIPDTNGGLIDRWINDAQRQICRSYNFAFMETETQTTTTEDQTSYSIPDGTGTTLRFKSEISLELIEPASSDRKLLKKTSKQDAERAFRTNKSGRPIQYAIQQKAIFFYPTPSGNSGNDWTINIEYYGYLDDLSADIDTNDLVDDFPEALEYLGTALALRYAMEEERAEFWENKFKQFLSGMVQEVDQDRNGTQELGMRPEPGAGTFPQPIQSDLNDNSIFWYY